MTDLLRDLNSAQKEAVTADDGPVLVVAGAGSGKTRVLTSRIAWLLAEGRARAPEVIAFTFTNRAAAEMRARVGRMVGEDRAPRWVGTFHATGVKLLRMEAEAAGLDRDFTIYDTDDSLRLLKKVMKDLGIDPKQFAPRAIRNQISRWKNEDEDVAKTVQQADTLVMEKAAAAWVEYEKGLRASNALDFDDLILRTVHLLEENEEVRLKYATRFKYVLVDEFQDTNPLQLVLIKALSCVHDNLFAVGDDDQAIYSWRGACVENMLEFEEYFPGTKLVRLEQNYRSTGHILKAANEVIANNTRRKGKNLWTADADGDLVESRDATDEEDEAAAVVDIVRREKRREVRLGDITVLYRTNAQSRALEASLGRAGIPHKVVGSAQFYERREVRDLMAYLKLVANPRDMVSAWRVINTPRRRIGDATVARVTEIAGREDCSPGEAVARPGLLDEVVAPAACRHVRAFFDMVAAWRAAEEECGVPALLERVVREVGYGDWLEKDDHESAGDRRANVDELVNSAYAWSEATDGGRLGDFLEHIALVSDSDKVDETEGAVRLMTIHTAKGLEFPVVIITGCEEGLLPHATSLMDMGDTEEERRLFYVALTRARRRSYLLHAWRRRRFGAWEDCLPSRFIGEIPDELLERHEEADRPAAAGGSLFGGGASSGVGGARRSQRPQRPQRRSGGAERPVWVPGAAAQAASKSTWDDDVNQVEVSYYEGQRVRHGSYGNGVVDRVEGSGADLLVTVDFDTGERKHLLPKFAPLFPV